LPTPGRLCAFVAAGGIMAAVAAAAAEAAGAPALDVGLDEAVWMALTNNRALRVQRLEPSIRQTFEDAARAAFDPVVSAGAAFDRTEPNGRSSATTTVDAVSGSLGLTQVLPTGTRLEAAASVERESGDGSLYGSQAEVSLTQALLQGRPIAVNLVSVRQARLDTAISAYELRGFVEALVAGVEHAYWECSLARRRVAIVEQSLTLAEQQLRDVEQRIKVGSLPETEVAAAQAEVALRREALINARSALAAANLGLLRLAAPEALSGATRSLALRTEPAVPAVELGPADSHVALALRQRPDLNQARLRAEAGDLELVRTRNGLLPRMDLFVTLGDTGYAQSFGDSVQEVDGQDVDVSAGVTLEWPVLDREARARHRRARFTREQLAESLRNLEDLVRVDVETGLLEVERTQEQVAATATTRRLQEEKLRAESAKFGVGRSTALLVAQAQRDVLSSQVGEVDAVVRHLQALVDFYRLEGSLLQRRGIVLGGGG